MFPLDIPEIIDYICNFLTIREMSNLRSVYKYFKDIVDNNYNFKTIKQYGKFKKITCLEELSNKGNLKSLMYLMNNYSLSLPNLNESFERCCSKGHLEMAKWLVSIKSRINIRSYNKAFIYSCENGHLGIAKWLLSINPAINIRLRYDESFRHSCRNGHLEVVKWLLSINSNINIHSYSDYVFRVSSESGHFETIKWLCSLCSDYPFIA